MLVEQGVPEPGAACATRRIACVRTSTSLIQLVSRPT
jgi:nitrogenase subunit NifH